jgi:hypothetical protein
VNIYYFRLWKLFEIRQEGSVFNTSDTGPRDSTSRMKLLRWILGVAAILIGSYFIYIALNQM